MEKGNRKGAKRRARGDGGVYKVHNKRCQRPTNRKGQPSCGCIWWISYVGPDGRRVQESSGSGDKGVAETLVRRRTGAREHNLPVVKNAERLGFSEAGQALLDDFTVNARRSRKMVERRIRKHLMPYFGNRRLVGIGAADVQAYIAHRKAGGIVAVRGKRTGERVADVSNSTINRELQVLKRIFSLAIAQDRIATRPHIAMLKEPAARSGFFDREQVDSVIRQLPEELGDVVEFAFLTGWRMYSEVLMLQWSHVDFRAGEVRLDAGTTKTGEPRTFPMTVELRRLLERRQVEHKRVRKAGHITPLVFFRMVANGRGGEKRPLPIKAFTKAWKVACRAAGCPGRIPHDLRRSAVRTFVRAGLGEQMSMSLSGHKTDSVFRRYNILTRVDQLDAARKLDAFASTTATRHHSTK